jgi:hypothetical protein
MTSGNRIDWILYDEDGKGNNHGREARRMASWRNEPIQNQKFQLLGGRIVFEFDAAKKQMIQKRGGPARVFTKEK